MEASFKSRTLPGLVSTIQMLVRVRGAKSVRVNAVISQAGKRMRLQDLDNITPLGMMCSHEQARAVNSVTITLESSKTEAKA